MALNHEVRCYFYSMEKTKSILTSIGMCLFWVVWAPCAFIKDLCALVAVPFDTQRLINTYLQTIRNAQNLGAVWTPVKPTQPQQPSGFRKIGFEGAPPNQPHQISGPVC